MPSDSIGFWVASSKERAIDQVGFTLYGHLFFLHGLEKGRLDFGWRPVDLVGKDKMRKDGPLTVEKVGILRVEDLGPGDIRGKEIGRELEPHKTAVNALRKRADRKRLCNPGHPFEKHVPVST